MNISELNVFLFCLLTEVLYIHVLHMTHLSTLPPCLWLPLQSYWLSTPGNVTHFQSQWTKPYWNWVALGSSTRDVKQRAESIPLCSVCVVVRAGSSPWSSACQRQGLHCSSSTSLPSSEVCAAAESRAALAGDSSGDRFYPPSPRWSISVCLAALCRGSWAACSECKDIPLSLLPTKTVLGLSGLILNGLGCENLSSWDGRLEGGV